jgi:hypothetical protein
MVFHSTAADCTFFSAARRTFFKIDHITGHKACLKKYNRPKRLNFILYSIENHGD